MVNISKQDSTKISEIINDSLGLLNDISKTVEAYTPVIVSAYKSGKLSIAQEEFELLYDHKEYLLDKYVRKTSFSKRVGKIEAAQEHMKLLIKSIPSSSSFSASQRIPKNRSIVRNSSKSKNQSLIQKARNDNNMIDDQNTPFSSSSRDLKRNADFEQLNKLLKIELQAKDKVINEKDIKILNLQDEIDKNKNEIEDLNDLISQNKNILPFLIIV